MWLHAQGAEGWQSLKHVLVKRLTWTEPFRGAAGLSEIDKRFLVCYHYEMSGRNIALELQKLGLDEREAKVYVAALELGPSPVQKIAQRADVPRATTYLVLDDLKAKGLVSTYDQGKKTFFVVESPEQLTQLVTQREHEVKLQYELVKDLVPELFDRGQFEQSARPTVKFYEGVPGLKSFVRDIHSAAGEEIVNIFCHDSVEDLFAQAGITWENIIERRRRTKTKRRALYTWKEHAPAEGRHNPEFTQYVPYAELPVVADISIKGNHVGLAPYDMPIRGVIIEDAVIANMMRLVFEKLWAQYRIEPTSDTGGIDKK